jgi:hypothetical protein
LSWISIWLVRRKRGRGWKEFEAAARCSIPRLAPLGGVDPDSSIWLVRRKRGKA